MNGKSPLEKKNLFSIYSHLRLVEEQCLDRNTQPIVIGDGFLKQVSFLFLVPTFLKIREGKRKSFPSFDFPCIF